MKDFWRDLVAYWRAPEDKWLKLAVYVGIGLHISFFISLFTGWWNPYFHHSAHSWVIQGGDFFGIYLAGHDLVHGANIYTSTADNPGYTEVVPYFFPFRYLPIVASIGAIFNIVSPWTAYWIWIVFLEFLFFASIAWLGCRMGSIRSFHIAAALYLFFTPWYGEIYMGQFDMLQSIFILGMLLSALGLRYGRSSGWWIMSVLLKLNTAICLPAFIKCKLWKPILVLIGIIILTCGPYFFLHPGEASKFLLTNFRFMSSYFGGETGIDFPFAELASPGNMGFQGLIAKLSMQHPHGMEVKSYYPFNPISIGVVILLSILATIRTHKGNFAECLCMWVAAVFITYTDVWEYHYVMLLPVIAFLYLKGSSKVLLLAWFVMIIPTRHIEIHSYILPNWDFWFLKPIAAFALYAYCTWLVMRKPRASVMQQEGS